jgi:hypothetical protein
VDLSSVGQSHNLSHAHSEVAVLSSWLKF